MDKLSIICFCLESETFLANYPRFPMKNVPRRAGTIVPKFVLLFAALLPLTATSTPQKTSAPPAAALKTFLERQGYGGTSLQRRLGNHL